MIKQKLLTFLGIFLSLAIAAGGWFLTSALIDMRSDALFSASGVAQMTAPDDVSYSLLTPQPSPSPTPPSEDVPQELEPSDSPEFEDVTALPVDSSHEKLPVLSEADMLSILKNWQEPGYERTHEPVAGQIDMEQAIERARAGLMFICDMGIAPVEDFEYYRTFAYLCQNIPLGLSREDDGQFFDAIYSYWHVDFTGENMNSTFIVNAVTGQVWKSSIDFRNVVVISRFDTELIEKTLITFMHDLGINSKSAAAVSYDRFDSGATAYQAFAEDNAVAVLRITNWISWENAMELLQIDLLLESLYDGFDAYGNEVLQP